MQKETQENKRIITITGMHCASCVNRIEKALLNLEGVDSVAVNLVTKKAFVKGNQTMESLCKTIEGLGFGVERDQSVGYENPERYKGNQPDAITASRKDLTGNRREKPFLIERKRLIVSAILTLPVFVVSMFHMQFSFSITLQFLLTTIVVFVPGFEIMKTAVKQIRRYYFGMETLIALGVGTAYLYSVFDMFVLHNEKLYFETGSMIITLMLIGRYLESKARDKAGDEIRRLMKIAPEQATVLRSGNEVNIPVSEIVLNDVVILRPGGKAPVDGIVLEGETDVNESMITGESKPVKKQASDEILCGSVNYNGTVKLKAIRIGNTTVVAQIIKTVEETQASKAPIQRIADKVASIFVPIVMGIALVTFTVWLLSGNPLSVALSSAISVLVIACPCALGLATPTAIIVSTGRAAGLGILIKNAASLELACKINVLVFDKTGTITYGLPKVTKIENLGDYSYDKILKITGSCERYSEHPYGKAISNYAAENGITFDDVKSFRSIPGMGMKAVFDKIPVLIGNEELMNKNNVYLKAFEPKINLLLKRGNTIIYFSANGLIKAVIAVTDEIRESVKPAIDKIKSMGIEPVMLTGDDEETAALIADRAGISKFKSRMKPDDKIDEIKLLQEGKNVVAMVGDGINDAPALAAADVSFAIGTGTDVAMETAGITLVKGDITKLGNAIELSHRTIKIIRQNLAWAFGYNFVMLPVAAFGFMNPMIAAGVMALSSVSVVINSLRLRK